MRVSSQQPKLQAAAETKEKTNKKQTCDEWCQRRLRLTYDLQLCPHRVTVGCAGLGDTTGHLT